MKRVLKFFVIPLALILCISAAGTNISHAASYPFILPDSVGFQEGAQFRKGTVIHFNFTMVHEYNHEGYTFNIYQGSGSNGNLVASSEDTFYVTSFMNDYSISWDTSNVAEGEYYAVLMPKFYSFMAWHESPSPDTCHFYVTSMGGYDQDTQDFRLYSPGENYPHYGDSVSYNGYTISRDYTDVTAKDSQGNPVKNQFLSDGKYTYYFQADGTAMTDRLTYHPDGTHVIYFDSYGHEVFNNFHRVEKGIAGDDMGSNSYCFFDINGYQYVNTVTFDSTGKVLLYINPYGLIEHNGWFNFGSNPGYGNQGEKWSLSTSSPRGYANKNGTLVRNTYMYNDYGQLVYMQGNGEAR